MVRTVLIGVAAASLLAAAPASAEVQLSMANGRVTLIANNATVREIMAEWARIGHTNVVNGERVTGAPLTLELRDMPESQALAVILRAVGGYIAAPRVSQETTLSKFDRILIMPTTAPVRTASTSAPPPPAFAPPPQAPTFNAPPPAADSPDANRINDLRNELLNRAQQTFQDLNNANTGQPAAPAPPVFQLPGQPQATPMPQPSQQPATSAPSAGSRRPGVIAPAPSPTPAPDR